MRAATVFSGGGGVEVFLKKHVEFVHAVEYDPQIAAVYAQNIGRHVQIARVEDVDYAAWGELDYLHASPSCVRASQANSNGGESDEDLSAARAVVRCLEATQPRVFTLENVQQYNSFKSYRLICQALDRLGYMWHAEVLNSADFGVPQTRRRLILRAVRDALLPGLPAPRAWVGWYAAIEDLIPTLPESAFAPWQLARLPEELSGSLAVAQGKYGENLVQVHADEPLFTVTANSNQSGLRAFIIDGKPAALLVAGANDFHPVDDQRPAMTVSTGAHRTRAWLSVGRVVRMTPRALARFQSFPDWYELPEKTALACRIIGNACPPLMMREIVLPLLRVQP